MFDSQKKYPQFQPVSGIIEQSQDCIYQKQAFEQFVTETFAPIYHQYEPRLVTYLMKGDRGERAGQYALLIEIESLEARDDLFPAEGQVSPALERVVAATAPIWEKLNTFVERFPDKHTDYVVL
jgi:hypothetical protein